MLQAVNALDSGPPVPAPSAYLLWDSKVIPPWAIRVLVLALILPVLLTTIDGVARARRRGHPILRWLLWVLAGALPFALALGLIVFGAKAGRAARHHRRRARWRQAPSRSAAAGIVVLVADPGRRSCWCCSFGEPLVGALTGGRSSNPVQDPGAGAAAAHR